MAAYGGDLLEDLHFEWIVAERERLRQQYQTDLVALIVANRSRRTFSVAAQYAQRLLETDPWREDAVRHLMSARYESGDGAGALAEYDRFNRELRAEMNVDPMPETVALREAIRRGAPIRARHPRRRRGKRAPFLRSWGARTNSDGFADSGSERRAVAVASPSSAELEASGRAGSFRSSR